MVEPELTEVGELHSLTDWQVSDASEEAELDEFCGGATRGTSKPGRASEITIKTGEEGRRKGGRDRHVHRRGGERSRQ